MKKYLYLQFKRLLKILPLFLCVVLVLFSGVAIIFSNIIEKNNQSENKKKFQIAIVMNNEENYLDMGIAALESFDSSRFALEVVKMEEKEALAAIESGKVSACVIVPDDFVEKALYGKFIPLKYITNDNSVGLVSIFKDEITQVVSEMLLQAQKGVYGINDALDSNGQASESYRLLNELNLEYVEFIFTRSNLYSATELGIADDLGLQDYLFCGIAILLFLLTALPFSVLFVRNDHSLDRVLASKRYSASRQVGAELTTFVPGMFALIAVMLISVCMVDQSEDGLLKGILTFDTLPSILLCTLPIVLMIASFSLLLFELTSDLVSGVILHFFATLSLCYVSGCLYPIFVFPEFIQKISAILPTGLARSHLATCITDQSGTLTALWLLLYSCLFFAITVIVRRHRLLKGRG